jgi:hypothetical protein
MCDKLTHKLLEVGEDKDGEDNTVDDRNVSQSVVLYIDDMFVYLYRDDSVPLFSRIPLF